MFRIGKEEVDAVSRVIMSGKLFRINSPEREAENFEHEFKDKVGSAHCLLLSSGTGALTAALAALGIGPGHEVIIPAYTFIATAVAVLSVGAIPVLCDVNETLTMDMDDMERKISPHTKAVMPVHIQGFPCKMDRLMELAKKHNFCVVEDACQAIGGTFNGKYLGTFGDAGAYSFNYFKIISAGEGGALVTNNLKAFERAIIYHDCGSMFWSYEQPIQEPAFIGTNMRVSEITGAIMREQLKRLDGILTDLRNVKKYISEQTQGYAGLRCNPSNDEAGDCGVQLSYIFDDEAKATKFEELVGGTRPINTGKHVYSEWSALLEKRGGHSKEANPYFFEQNKGLNMDFTPDSCKKTLDVLRRSVYIGLHCDWDEAKIAEKIALIRSAADQL